MSDLAKQRKACIDTESAAEGLKGAGQQADVKPRQNLKWPATLNRDGPSRSTTGPEMDEDAG